MNGYVARVNYILRKAFRSEFGCSPMCLLLLYSSMLFSNYNSYVLFDVFMIIIVFILSSLCDSASCVFIMKL